MIDLTTPEAQIAQHYMRHTKGIDVIPHDVDKLDDQPCWYFYYALPQGELELEVFYDTPKDDWAVTVTAFPVAI
ncbi:MAG: hypothetical protein HOV97_05245 [Nonomuraea sp.]|nr:hypothetical protein [Nonomuraea sp.]